MYIVFYYCFYIVFRGLKALSGKGFRGSTGTFSGFNWNIFRANGTFSGLALQRTGTFSGLMERVFIAFHFVKWHDCPTCSSNTEVVPYDN